MQSTPNTKTLIKSTVAASLLAAVALICFILPAEYNVDPTGIGAKLDLVKLAHATEQQQQQQSPVQPPPSEQSDTIEVTVPPGKGIEYKFNMNQYAKMTYEWETDGSPLFFDLHGEPAGDTSGYFESYAITTSAQMKGSFTAPFDGSHGWYWKNKSDKPVAIQLMVAGQYLSLSHISM